MARRLLQLSQVLLCLSMLAYATSEDVDELSPRQSTQQKGGNTANCRCFPGDACWPSTQEWNDFNKTLGGKLIVTVPIASACHVDPYTAYDAQKCADLQAVWEFPSTHFTTSSSVMAPFFANQSCDPFLPKSAQCVIGSYIQYAVRASGADDYAKTIAFTKAKNIRLVIRNTGHDYIGKSTGAGAVGIWTHNIKDMQIVDYKSKFYTGKAMKMGAGVQAIDADNFAHAQGLMVVGGNCQTVGLAGGYTQGGGHGPLASKLGLAADQVLEWEVVTGTGQLLVASQSQNSDLYWALSGGGGGTYGVVLSMTSKAYPDVQVAAANLTFTNQGVSQDTFYSVVQTFITNLPQVVDAGATSIWLLLPNIFLMTPTTAPGLTKSQLQTLMDPVLAKLNQSGMPYTYFIDEYASYLDSYVAMTPPSNITEFQLGGRLIPRSLVQQNPSGLTSALRYINENGAVISGVSVKADLKPGTPSNSVNPAWRTAVFDAVLGTPYSYTNWTLDLANQKLMTDTLLPQLENLTPNGGVYLNEADFRQPDFQTTFYGGNYQKLLAIKNKYDPDNIFYALTGVGSDQWTQAADGRLCKVSSGSSD